MLRPAKPDRATANLAEFGPACRRLLLLRLLLLALIPGTAGAAETAVVPLPGAHAHNDYLHGRPLLDALDQGFCSVEADIHLVEGRLLVAHDRGRAQTERTLEALYLEPLRARVRAHGGRVYPGGPTFWLLIDFKTEPAATWGTLEPVIEQYREMLTVFRADSTETNAVTIVLSGNSPRELLATETNRLAAVDGRPADLDLNPSRHLVPWISDNWNNHFRWRGLDAMPEAERQKLRVLVTRAHEQGRWVRLWAAPDLEASWREQIDAGVNLINTDRLQALADFLRR